MKLNGKKILEHEFMDTFLKKATGILFKKKISKAYVFRFKKPRKIGITMMFVFQKIDLIYVDKGKVVELASLGPFQHYFPQNKTKIVIEVPQNTINKHKIKLGDKITI